MKKLISITAIVGTLAVVMVLVIYLRRPVSVPRSPVPCYDFLEGLSQALIEDRGFLSLCWKEPLTGGWTREGQTGEMTRWQRRLAMPLELDTEFLQLYVGDKSWNQQFPPQGEGSPSWAVEFGNQFNLQFRYLASENCWAATERYLFLGPATLWLEIHQAHPQENYRRLSLWANNQEIRKVTLPTRPTRQYRWPITIADEMTTFRLRISSDEVAFPLDQIQLRGGLIYPSRLVVNLPMRKNPKVLEQLSLYYRPKNFDQLLPTVNFQSRLPKGIRAKPEWMVSYTTAADITRPALRLLPGQSVRFPLWLVGHQTAGTPELPAAEKSPQPPLIRGARGHPRSTSSPESPLRPGEAADLHLAWCEQASSPLPWGTTGELCLRLIPAAIEDTYEPRRQAGAVQAASPPVELWRVPLSTTRWQPSSEWKEATVSLTPWLGQDIQLELSFEVASPVFRFQSQAAYPSDFSFARVALLPVSTPAYRDPLRPSIILIGHDTLRADALSCYGYRHPTTPFLDALATQSTRYALTYSVASFTLPSFASMFTSRYPSEHTASVRYRPLPLQVTTVAEILKAHGYQTAAFVDKGFLDPVYGLNQGFEYYDNKGERLPGIYPRALDWLDRRDPNRPFFLFLHYYDTHAPYASPPEFRYRFHPNPGYNRIEAIRYEAPPSWLNKIGEMDLVLEPQDIEHLRALYDGAVNWVDANLFAFVREIRHRQLFSSSLLIFTSDHGEAFGEHQQFTHGATLYEILLRVPLIIKWPYQERAGQVVRTPVTLLDLAPTMLHAAGIPVPSDWQGIPLDAVPPGVEPPVRPLFAQLPYKDLAAVIQFPYKYILNTSGGRSWGQLYNLLHDPQELHDLSRSEPEKVAELLALLENHLADTPPLIPSVRREVSLDMQVLADLERLGYIAR